jgi:hypothetical protein
MAYEKDIKVVIAHCSHSLQTLCKIWTQKLFLQNKDQMWSQIATTLKMICIMAKKET